MIATTGLRFAGDVKIEEVQLNSLNGQVANITAQIVSIEIYEDLFSPFISVSIVLRESVDYINLFPFIGEEFVDISISTPGIEASKAFKGRFYIYKIVDRENTKDREVVYTIKAISQEFLLDVNKKISKAFKGNISESAESLIKKEGLESSKKYVIEKTTNTTKFIANYWSPIKCLNTLAAQATNANKSPSYLFFENRDGFNFRSLDDLMKMPVYHKFIKDNYSRTPTADGVNSVLDPNEDYKRILEFSVPVVTDYIEDSQSGRLKSRLIGYDLVTKKYIVQDYNIKKDTQPMTLLNPNPAYSKYATANPASTLLFMSKHYANFNNFTDVTNFKTIQRRMSFLQSLNKYKVTLQANGRTDYTVGQIYDLNIPKATQITKADSDPRDLILSGKYMVSAVSHMITREKHVCNFELIKNSILADLTKT